MYRHTILRTYLLNIHENVYTTIKKIIIMVDPGLAGLPIGYNGY